MRLRAPIVALAAAAVLAGAVVACSPAGAPFASSTGPAGLAAGDPPCAPPA